MLVVNVTDINSLLVRTDAYSTLALVSCTLSSNPVERTIVSTPDITSIESPTYILEALPLNAMLPSGEIILPSGSMVLV